MVDPSKKVPDLKCEVQDLLLEVVDLKHEVPDLRSGGIPLNLTPGLQRGMSGERIFRRSRCDAPAPLSAHMLYSVPYDNLHHREFR